MNLTFKSYKNIKTKLYIKKNTCLYFFYGVNKNAHKSLIIEQEIKKLNFKFYKITNKTALNTVKNSIFNNVSFLINGPTLFFNNNKQNHYKDLINNSLINNIEPFYYYVTAIKLHNKIYESTYLKKINSLSTTENNLILYQFNITNLKRPCYKFKN